LGGTARADAVGLLGEDRGGEFTLDKLEAPKPFDPRRRDMYLSVVERERADRQKAEEAAQVGSTTPDSPVLVAVATKGGGRINLHFGHATEFQIYEVDSRGARFVGHRRTEKYCGDGHGEVAAMEATIAALEGVSAVLCAKIGERPRERLAAAGVTATDRFAFEYIEASAITWCSTRFQSPERAASA
jgi:nitrogen fixation protein NifB